jgi:hypothetical protein
MATDFAATATTALVRNLEIFHKSAHELAEPLSQSQFWAKPIDPGNSFGHLVLHLTGNLKHRAGALLGGTGYVRDREREFAQADVPPKAEALADLDDAIAVFRRVVAGMSAERLAEPYPEGLYPTVLDGLIALVAHFALHRGQMSYIARLVQK